MNGVTQLRFDNLDRSGRGGGVKLREGSYTPMVEGSLEGIFHALQVNRI